MHHILLQRPRFERVGRRLAAELWRFAGFAVKNAVVGSEAAFFDDRRCRDDLFAGGAGSADLSDIFIAFQRSIEELSVYGRWFFGNGERSMDLRRVAPVADSELGYDDATFSRTLEVCFCHGTKRSGLVMFVDAMK